MQHPVARLERRPRAPLQPATGLSSPDSEKTQRHDTVPHQADFLGHLPVLRGHDHHVPDLLRDPGRSGRARRRQVAPPRPTSPASGTSCTSTSRSGSSTSRLRLAPDRPRLARTFVREPSERRLRSSARTRPSRPRSCSAARSSGSRSRSRSAILSALRPRSIMDRFSMTFVLIGISAHPVWIGLILSYVFGYRLAPHADRRLLQLLPGDRRGAMQRPGQLGLPPDPALDHVHDPVRRALRPAGPGQRDGDDVRGLRADRARQGRVAERA